MEVKERYSVGVSSVLEIVCHECYKQTSSTLNNEMNKKMFDGEYPIVVEPKLSSIGDSNSKKYSFLDFESNILSLVACLQVGCGSHEVGLVMSNLNLNKAYMLERAYYNYIDRISVHLREASDFFVRRSLDAEVVETYKNQLRKKGMDDETIEEKAKEVKKKELTELVGLDVAYDMGWQKRSSGRRYDSKSGHAFLIGLTTNKIIGVVVFCKDCRKCMEAEKKGVPPEPHAN